MAETELETQMKWRVRKHMLSSLGGLFLAIGLMMVAGFGAKSIFGPSPPAFVRIIPVLGILVIPAVGFWSTFKNLRCPACEGLVIFQVSTQYSMFGAMASKDCRHCGKKIFADDIPQRFRRMVLIMMAVGFTLAIVSAILSATLAPHR